MDSFTSRTENFASALAYRMSTALIRSTPPPMHQPWIEAMVGVRQSATALIACCNSLRWVWNLVRGRADTSPDMLSDSVLPMVSRSRP